MKSFETLIEIVSKLRAPDGCPWDKKQTHDSLLPFLFEECNEVADTIISKDYNHLREELGDILLHILLHSEIAKENKMFTIEDVIKDISDKLLRRHPHVFGDQSAETAEDVNKIWEQVKTQERKKLKHISILDKIPMNFQPLLRSYKLQKEASKVGFDWDNYKPVLEKIKEEIIEVSEAIESKSFESIEHEIGDLLFSVINLGRFLDVNSDVALSKCNKRFYERFRLVEEQVKNSGRDFSDFSLEDLDQFWNNAKKLLLLHDFESAIDKL